MVTGLARSGTTLLAECLNHHPSIMCVADCTNELLKGFVRYAYYKIENEKKDVMYPMDNYFFIGSPKVKEFIAQTDLRHEIPGHLRESILERTIVRDGFYCPEIIESVKKCQAKTFDALFLEIINILYSTYGNSKTEYFGVKTVWCEQMTAPLSKTFPNMSFVNIIRDPRAVAASNYVTQINRYPLLFTIRDWRKSVYCSWKFSRMDSISRRFITLRYEDLVDNPEKTLGRVTGMIGMDFDEKMIKQPFKRPNTNYDKESAGEEGISLKFKEKWKKTLPENFIMKIEEFAVPEMKKVNYRNLFQKSTENFDALVSWEDIPYQSISAWCKDIVQSEGNYKNAWQVNNTLLEIIRLNLIKMKTEISDKYLLEQFFFEKGFYLWLKEEVNE